MGFFDKFKQGLAKTKALLTTDVRDLFKAGEILGEEQLEQFHARLISTDMGVVAAQAITDELRKQHLGRTVDVDALWLTVKDTLKGLLTGEDDVVWDPEDPLSPLNLSPEGTTVILVAGVNGVGKTTSIAKLANFLQKQGKTVLLAAGDTFRAAAVEQLTMWSERLNCEIVTKPDGTDPAAVAHAGCSAAVEKGIDVVIIDTAGRLQTQKNLMNELSKVERVIQKVIPEGPHEVLLVLDATTGQNGISQAKNFSEAVKCTGIVLAKLDGTAKGGVVVAIRREMGLPVKYIGVGEQIDDLQLFAPDAFVDALIDA
ncbi:Signal recognition particle receptor FtsY [Symmachiella macrocystis]|uniref:Signal recognition particle receptor FtsY n=1 Tax=Symmachiella macrocystis TaxID=2527985 RepID=A0A5C6BK41_9PLAN|nr:signal recognition particle-docking protein FtsY [Symmachiella macrocystis]TWU12365.1 Signal recognition particle receptor FtsY [Symmachiella macrocystis]